MKIKCKKNETYEELTVLPTKEDEKIIFDNLIIANRWFSVGNQLVGYHLTPEEEYVVYGIMQYNGHLDYLIMDDSSIPAFAPHSIFEITDKTIPFDWSVNSYELKEAGTMLLIGYEELTKNYESLLDLICKREHAIKSFLKYKAAYEYWQE